MLAEKPREEGQGQPWGETIHSSLSFIPGGAGPRSGHGWVSHRRMRRNWPRTKPQRAWRGCGASRGEPGPQDNSRGQGVQRLAGLRGAGTNRGPTARAKKAGESRTLGSTSRGPPCLLPPEAPCPSVPSRRPRFGDWPSIPYLRWHPTQRGDVSVPSSVADSWHVSLKRPDGSWGVDHPQRERARGDLHTGRCLHVLVCTHTWTCAVCLSWGTPIQELLCHQCVSVGARGEHERGVVGSVPSVGMGVGLVCPSP